MRRFYTVMTAVALTVATVFSGVSTVQAGGYHEYDVEKYVMNQLSAASVPGVSVSIVSDQKEIYSATFGVDGKTQSDYVLGNLTQSMTALGVLSLAEDGEIKLEDDITKYLPKYSALKGVTIEKLLHQTTGIKKETMLDQVKAEGKEGIYQNAYVNYSILGELIESVSGETYEEYLTENILDACGMTSTYSLRQNPEMQEEMSPAYKNYFGYPVAAKYQYNASDQWATVSSGYMISDVKDMGKYLQMYLKEGGDVVNPEDIAGVLQNTVPVINKSKEDSLYGTEEAYGMGWMATQYKGTDLYYQSGVLENQMTMMALIPDKKIGFVMLFNGGDYLVGKQLMEKICVDVTDIFLGEKAANIPSNSYLLQHGLIDLLLLIILVGCSLPIFMTGIWRKRAAAGFHAARLVKDILIQIVLPTAVLVVVQKEIFPWKLLYRIVPDVVIVAVIAIALLYIGGLLKLLRSVAMVVRYKLDPEGFHASLTVQDGEEVQAGELMELVLDTPDKSEETEAEVEAAAVQMQQDAASQTSEATETPEATETQEATETSDVSQTSESEQK